MLASERNNQVLNNSWVTLKDIEDSLVWERNPYKGFNFPKLGYMVVSLDQLVAQENLEFQLPSEMQAFLMALSKKINLGVLVSFSYLSRMWAHAVMQNSHKIFPFCWGLS